MTHLGCAAGPYAAVGTTTFSGRSWTIFTEIDRAGLVMYGQMTAGSWIYIGSQSIVQGTFETFSEIGRRHYGGDLRGRWILTGGLGGMGGAQPLAATMAGASLIAVECQRDRIEFRQRTGYLDAQAHTIDEALAIVERSHADGAPISRWVARQRGARSPRDRGAGDPPGRGHRSDRST